MFSEQFLHAQVLCKAATGQAMKALQELFFQVVTKSTGSQCLAEFKKLTQSKMI
jgi:hypothetical protein